jgi:Ran GTPase-activating protein (RanGAP) involved in mRNA processing and transport
MELDFSKNNLTDTSLKYLADILRKFNGIRSLNISNLSKMKESGFIELAKAIRDNTSLVSIDISKNSMKANILYELCLSIADNYVISEIKLDLKGKALPFGFSTYTLMSMYDVYMSR